MKSLGQPLPPFSNSFLTQFIQNAEKDPNINFVSNEENPFLKDIRLGRRLVGGREDDFYLENDYHRINVRRGSSIYDLKPKGPIIARKGLQKFFYLKYSHICENAKPVTEGKRSKREKNKAWAERRIKEIIFNDVREAIKNQRKIVVYQTEKANGENCQISFLPQISSWVISSKNVALIAQSSSDLQKYLSKPRYSFAHLIAQCWFDILKSRQISLPDLKNDLANRTLVGEYCGNPEYLHLVNYQSVDLHFYAIVDHDSPFSCISPQESFEIFKKHKLTSVSCQKIGEFTTFNELTNGLKEVYSNVSMSLIDESGEGCVLYIAEKTEKNENVLSLCKLKTLEYMIFRKLREKLKALNRESGAENFRKNKALILFERFKSETLDLCRDFKPAKPLSSYFRIADWCFKHAPQKKIECFLSFLKEAKTAIEIDKTTDSELVYEIKTENSKQNVEREKSSSESEAKAEDFELDDLYSEEILPIKHILRQNEEKSLKTVKEKENEKEDEGSMERHRSKFFTNDSEEIKANEEKKNEFEEQKSVGEQKEIRVEGSEKKKKKTQKKKEKKLKKKKNK